MRWNPRETAVDRQNELAIPLHYKRRKNNNFTLLFTCVCGLSKNTNKSKCIPWNVFVLTKATNHRNEKTNPKPYILELRTIR